MWAVWQSRTGEEPLPISPGWLRTMTWAVKVLAPLAGSFLLSEATLPRLISLTETFLTLNPTLSPGSAWERDSWCISTDFSGQLRWGESHKHTWLDDTGLNTADWDCSDTANFVDILEGKSKWLVGWSGWGNDGIQGFEHSFAGELAFLHFLAPSLVPGHVWRWFDHVVAVPSGDWDESDRLGVVADFLDVVANFRRDFVKSLFRVGWFS